MFTSNITGLTANTTYYLRAYATNSVGTSYGDQKTFVTPPTTPIVITNTVTDITQTTSVCGGNVENDGGASVTERGVCWSTSQNPTISNSHTNNGNGTGSFISNITGLTLGTTYYVRAYATNYVGTTYGEQRSFTTYDPFNGHEYVDLGLPSGLLWATCNVGADSPEEYGGYYAWGETTTKSEYTWANYLWCDGTQYVMTKYNTNPSYGPVDHRSSLLPEDDAAHVNWGGDWRMPTKSEMEELMNNCTWTWTIQNGVSGRMGTGYNGNSIFLPATGYYFGGGGLINAGLQGGYHSNKLYFSYTDESYLLYFSSYNISVNDNFRAIGQSVRAVCVPSKK